MKQSSKRITINAHDQKKHCPIICLKAEIDHETCIDCPMDMPKTFQCYLLPKIGIYWEIKLETTIFFSSSIY